MALDPKMVEEAVKKLEVLSTKLPKPAGDLLDDLSKKIKQPKAHIFGGALAVLALIIFYLTPNTVLFDLVGGAYPVYASLKMLSAKTFETEAALWTTYWILFTIIRSLSCILDSFLGMLPFGSLVKMVAVVYLYKGFGGEPGAKLFLEKVLEPKVFPLLQTAAAAEAPKAK
eukprot:TRINITY_DN18218_c0_g1_i1.p1 TRINITY_DN18218_c0_g1~~TRINITY_DN18218_c0_g1_i1.p1  ORF type:complete len:171 (+),score=59.04 TRINITY_DN18218_c0_g1_i1:91-603(+)